MLYLICYDIKEDRRRRQVQHLLEGAGERVLFSVFECLLSDAQVKHIRKEIEKLIDPKADNVKYYEVCGLCAEKIEFLGTGAGAVMEVDPYYMV